MGFFGTFQLSWELVKNLLVKVKSSGSISGLIATSFIAGHGQAQECPCGEPDGGVDLADFTLKGFLLGEIILPTFQQREDDLVVHEILDWLPCPHGGNEEA